MVKVNSNIFGSVAIIVTVFFEAVFITIGISEFMKVHIGVACTLLAGSLLNAFVIIKYFIRFPRLFLKENILIVKRILAEPLFIELRNIRSVKEKRGISFIRKGDPNKKIYVLNYRLESDDYQITFADTFSDGSKVVEMAYKIKAEILILFLNQIVFSYSVCLKSYWK